MNRPLERRGAQLGTDDAGTPHTATVLWTLLGSGVTWALHLLVSYVVIAWACTINRAGLVQPMLFCVSVVALLGIVWTARLSWKHWRLSRAVGRHGDDSWDARLGERTSRVTFVMVSGLFLALIFGLGVLYATSTIMMTPPCEAGISA